MDGRVATYREFPQLSLYQRIADQRLPSAEKRILRKADRAWHNDLQRLVDNQNGFDVPPAIGQTTGDGG